jgi:DNA polymerase-4
MGSEYKKPDAVTVIGRENYRDLLWPLPSREFFGVGSATAKKLGGLGITTIGEIANADAGMLASVFGKQGEVMYAYANGIDDSPVRPAEESRKIKSVGNGVTFRRDLKGEADIRTALVSLADTVAGRLRKHGLKCGGVKVDVKDPSFKTVSRQMQLIRPTWLAEDIRAAALKLIKDNWDMDKPIRLITVTGIRIGDEETPLQLSFLGDNTGAAGNGTPILTPTPRAPEDDPPKGEQLERAMDKIREKYGNRSITYGAIIGNDIGIDMDEHREDTLEE